MLSTVIIWIMLFSLLISLIAGLAIFVNWICNHSFNKSGINKIFISFLGVFAITFFVLFEKKVKINDLEILLIYFLLMLLASLIILVVQSFLIKIINIYIVPFLEKHITNLWILLLKNINNKGRKLIGFFIDLFGLFLIISYIIFSIVIFIINQFINPLFIIGTFVYIIFIGVLGIARNTFIKLNVNAHTSTYLDLTHAYMKVSDFKNKDTMNSYIFSRGSILVKSFGKLYFLFILLCVIYIGISALYSLPKSVYYIAYILISIFLIIYVYFFDFDKVNQNVRRVSVYFFLVIITFIKSYSLFDTTFFHKKNSSYDFIYFIILTLFISLDRFAKSLSDDYRDFKEKRKI